MTAVKKKQATFPLRLPESMKIRVEKLAVADGVSINQYIALAVAEKLGASAEREFFIERQRTADAIELRAFLTREGGEVPGAGDEIRQGD
jgi:hypothetical protein